MAERRMFAMEVIDQDYFLDMPTTAQCLYFHLGIHSDENGNVCFRNVMDRIGASKDDLSILIAKKLVVTLDQDSVHINYSYANNGINPFNTHKGGMR